MNHHRYFLNVQGRRVRCCIIGTGGFGRSFLAQTQRIPMIETRIAVDLTAEAARDALVETGVAPDAIRLCQSATQAREAYAAGHFVAAGDFGAVCDLDFDVAVEATGHPESGARHAQAAIDAGKHVALVTKEVDSVVGPGLSERARRNGLVVTPVDGDQPSLLIGLVTWAQILGLEIVAAGKSSEYDFVYDPAAGTLTSNGVTIAAPGFGSLIDPGGRALQEVVAARSATASALPQRAVPDLCELTVVANATGFMPDRADLHAPIARIVEVADLFAVAADGGILRGHGRLDVFHCLRLPGEPSFAGGVFVVVACTHADTWAMLADKGHVVSRSGRTALLYLPRHLLGVEAATSILEAGLLGVSSGAERPRAHCDLVAFADADLTRGTVLTARGHHHTIENVSGRMVQARPLGPETPVPYYLAANRTLLRDVRAGSTLTCADVELDPGSVLLALRRDQDAGGETPAP